MKKTDSKVVGNIRVGKPDVDPEAPSHVRGVAQGNKHLKEALDRGARRSTGIRAKGHEVIDPRMPKLSPA
ncbi:MAG TPA: hypothetical protein VGF94_27220 [Kofleriaceae bacterium]